MRFWRGLAYVFWKELFELFQKPSLPIGLLVFSVAVVWTSGKLNLGPLKPAVFLYTDGASEAALGSARSILAELAHIRVIERSGTVDADDMQAAGANLAVTRSAGTWSVLYRFPTSRQETDASHIAGLIGYSLRAGKPAPVLLAGGDRASGGIEISLGNRISAMPGEAQLLMVPRTVALVVVFLAFVLATRSYSREITFGTLPLLISHRNGGWPAMAAAKIAACVWVSGMLLLVLLLTVWPMFGLMPKPGFLAQLGVQMLAMIASACLGLAVAILARNQSQVHLFIAVYFIGLVLVSGFLFTIETAAPAIRVLSYASPLTFSGPVLESWMFYGTSALWFSSDLSWLAAQGVIIAALLAVAIGWSRRRV